MHHSVCPLDCPDRCSLTVQVKDDGQVGRLGGSHHNPLTAGFICSKVAGFARRVHGPERVLQPSRRVGPRGPGATFEPISWDEALDTIATRWRALIDEHGGSSILPVWYGGSNGYLTGGGLDAHLWAALGTARAERTLCATNAGAAVKMTWGDLPGNDPADIVHAQLAVLWGVNPHASGVHLVPLVKRVLDQGGQVAIVDPRATPFAERAALVLQPLPGTDVALALALQHLAFARGWVDRDFLGRWTADHAALEAHVAPWTPARAAQIAGVRARDIEALAELYAATNPAMIRAGWGMERNRNGTDGIRAVLALPAIYGKFGVRGGGYAMSTSAGYGVDKARYAPAHQGPVHNLSQLGRALLDGEPTVRSVYVYDCNPVATVPDQQRTIQGLSRDDLFVVVHEQVFNDTTDYADIVLPATTFLEHRELSRSYGGYILQWADPVIPPVGEARCNHDVMAELGLRLGVDLGLSEEDIARRLLAAMPTLDDTAWDRLQTDKVIRLPTKVQFLDVFPATPGSVVGASPPHYRPPPVDAARAFVVISPASTRGISSTLFETLGNGEAVVGIHPEDADRIGVRDGDAVRLVNSGGQVEIRALRDATLRPGVLSVPKGLWRRSSLNGHTSNTLIPDHVDEHGLGACYNDARADLMLVD